MSCKDSGCTCGDSGEKECDSSQCGSCVDCSGGCGSSSEPKDVYEEALELWGTDSQLLSAAKDASELSASITGLLMGSGKPEDVANKVADCYIILEQVKRIFGSEAINKIEKFKLDKLREFIDMSKEAQDEARKEAESKAFAESLKGK